MIRVRPSYRVYIYIYVYDCLLHFQSPVKCNMYPKFHVGQEAIEAGILTLYT